MKSEHVEMIKRIFDLVGASYPDGNGIVFSDKNDQSFYIDGAPFEKLIAAIESEHSSELRRARNEAESLATGMHRDFYCIVSPCFELCDSVPGVLSQIDNMYAGIREIVETQRAKIAELERENERLEKETIRWKSLGLRVVGSHNAPTDCYTTGPLTGDWVMDHAVCPSCMFLAAYNDKELDEDE